MVPTLWFNIGEHFTMNMLEPQNHKYLMIHIYVKPPSTHPKAPLFRQETPQQSANTAQNHQNVPEVEPPVAGTAVVWRMLVTTKYN